MNSIYWLLLIIVLLVIEIITLGLTTICRRRFGGIYFMPAGFTLEGTVDGFYLRVLPAVDFHPPAGCEAFKQQNPED